MIEVGALYRCVCGTDVPFREGETVVCPSCRRKHRHAPGKELGAADTLILSSRRTDTSWETPAVGTDTSVITAQGTGGDRPNLVGQVLDHFEVLEELGRGGMGTVYRALDRSLERYVALKVLNSEEALEKKDLVEAFTHEARTQARMNHPGITTIYYIGKFREMTYFAMEIVPGQNLESRMKDGHLPFREVISAGVQVVQALKEAKERGVIHRDIKPGNMILSSSGRVKITDFGLSKTEKGGLQITGARHITGTPYYIAPEQARGETTDFRADIYSLGATLYHLAYGMPPFEGEHFMAVISKHLSEPLKFPDSPPRDVPPGFPLVLERMMAKKPEERFQSYEELEQALLELRPEAQRVAALGRRAVAAFLDYAAVSIVAGFIVGLFTFLSESEHLSSAFQMQAYGAAGLVCVLDQALRGTTMGKTFGKLRIARLDGRPIERWRLFVRGLFQFLPLIASGLSGLGNALGLGLRRGIGSYVVLSVVLFIAADFLWAARNRNKRTLHDLILGTWVLDKV